MIAGPDLRLLSPGFSRAIDVSFPLLEVGKEIPIQLFSKSWILQLCPYCGGDGVDSREALTSRRGNGKKGMHKHREQLPLLLLTR